MSGVLIREVIYQDTVTDLLVSEKTASPAPADIPGDVRELDGRGLIAIPGLVDVHVHFRDPGLTEKEDVLTGARAAAAGGYTTVACEPNTRPVIDTTERVKDFYARVNELGIPLNVWTKGAVSYGEQGEELTDIPSLAAAHIAAMSDDGEPLVNTELLTAAFRAAGDALVLTAHCEETPRSSAKVQAALGAGTPLRREVELIRLNIAALEAAGTGRLHIQHVSLAESAEVIVDAKRRGLAVTAEVTPHHLLLCEDDIAQGADGPDANWKMNPPLRSREDMLAMRRALADGVIDLIATDHAPHTVAEKAQPWDAAPFGIIGLETALGACLTLVQDRTLSMTRLVEAMSLAPMRLLPTWAQAAQGGCITLLDPQAAWTVDPDTFYSKARNCPFAGMTFPGKAMYTVFNGQLVMADGEVLF